MPSLSIADEFRLTVGNLGDIASDLVSPSLRIGVTGLSRAGKTVFLTALIHHLLHPTSLPGLKAHRSGRLIGAKLSQQPDDSVPRFAFEEHVRKLVEERDWPTSTRQISELRVSIEYESNSALARALGRSTLELDFVDYPGEWLLDLPLLDLNYAAFSKQALDKARHKSRAALANPFLELVQTIDPTAPLDESAATQLAETFSAYLKACRSDETSLSMLPPGRFLMPGDLEGSPALTFAPLDLTEAQGKAPSGSLHAAMKRRYDAYKRLVVKPFFMEHFARLDRQVVLVDTMAAINAGADALADLQDAIAAILMCFKPGKRNLLSRMLGPNVDRLAFAATKADHLHHEQHDRLEAILENLVQGARDKALFSGAKVETIALGSVRATREATTRHRGETLKAVTGTPMKGEKIAGEVFDGEREAAIFPGDLPDRFSDLFAIPHSDRGPNDPLIRFVRFRPPKTQMNGNQMPALPHIRMDRLLEFLIGDRLD
ncbi:MAG: YcjX family protein [Pseudomonadota bacterium]